MVTIMGLPLLPFPAGTHALFERVDYLLPPDFNGLGFYFRPQPELLPTAFAAGHGVVGVAVGNDDLSSTALEALEVDWNDI